MIRGDVHRITLPIRGRGRRTQHGTRNGAIGAIDQELLGDRVGQLTREEQQAVDEALRLVLDLS